MIRSNSPIDDSPLVTARRPRVQLVDTDRDGRPDVYLYDCDHNGEPEIEHHVAARRTVVTLPHPMPWEVPPSVTLGTGDSGAVPLRVTCRVIPLGGKAWEVNGTPALPPTHAMASLSLAWDADREREDEVRASYAVLQQFGGAQLMERI